MYGQCHGKRDKLINIGHIYILTDLDIGNYRQPHLKPNVRVRPMYVRASEGHTRQGLQGQADSSYQGTDGEVVAVVVVVVVVVVVDDDMKLPHETVAVSARSMYTIQWNLHHATSCKATYVRCMRVHCNLPPTVLAE